VRRADPVARTQPDHEAERRALEQTFRR
jgi:hypothetical protein